MGKAVNATWWRFHRDKTEVCGPCCSLIMDRKIVHRTRSSPSWSSLSCMKKYKEIYASIVGGSRHSNIQNSLSHSCRITCKIWPEEFQMAPEHVSPPTRRRNFISDWSKFPDINLFGKTKIILSVNPLDTIVRAVRRRIARAAFLVKINLTK